MYLFKSVTTVTDGWSNLAFFVVANLLHDHANHNLLSTHADTRRWPHQPPSKIHSERCQYKLDVRYTNSKSATNSPVSLAPRRTVVTPAVGMKGFNETEIWYNGRVSAALANGRTSMLLKPWGENV
jgi:hypothetical protein